MSDIVERLRDASYTNAPSRCMEAAKEIERLRKTIALHAGDAMSLSNELDEWRGRALAAEEALANSSGIRNTEKGNENV